jgi:hypothetical protein
VRRGKVETHGVYGSSSRTRSGRDGYLGLWVGWTVEGTLDVEEAYAAKIDEWIVWEAGEERARRGGQPLLFFLFVPKFAASL